MESNQPKPRCSTCLQSGGPEYQPGGDFFQCTHCGTEMRYLPAGELWNGGDKKKKKNNGWITTFSVPNCDLAPHQRTALLGVAIVLLSCAFLTVGKIDLTTTLLAGGSGLLLAVIGRRKTRQLAGKMRATKIHFPYWHR